MNKSSSSSSYADDIAAKRWCRYVPVSERPVLSALITAIIDSGHTITIHDGEERVVNRSTDKALCRSMLGHTGEDYLTIGLFEDGDILGSFYLVYDNGSEDDPMVVISDYSANELCEAIYRQLEVKYGQ